MKIFKFSVLLSLLASCAFGRPKARIFDDVEPLPQTSHVTAFVNRDDGLVVECWEVDALLPRNDNQKAYADPTAPRVMEMGVGAGGVTGVDIVTWPGPVDIYPPPNDIHSNAFDLSLFPSSFTIKGGLIYIESMSIFSESNREETEMYFFNAENGDDWFYIEDQTSSAQCAKNTKRRKPLTMSAVSSTETTLIRFKYKITPKHKVLHKGRCNFAGLKPDEPRRNGKEDGPVTRFVIQQDL